jgi:peroxiredoxin Q/BCP
MASLQIGSKAPDFTVNDQDGKPVKLSDFKGKKVVLYFYPKDMTPGCTAEACDLRDNYTLLQKRGYEVLGVSTDSEKLHQKFIAQEKLPFRLLADIDKKLHELYGTWVEKSMYGRKFMGTARITFIIDENGTIEDIVSKVDTKNHTRQILKDIPAAKTPVKKAVSKTAEKTIKAVAKKAVAKTQAQIARKKK